MLLLCCKIGLVDESFYNLVMLDDIFHMSYRYTFIGYCLFHGCILSYDGAHIEHTRTRACIHTYYVSMFHRNGSQLSQLGSMQYKISTRANNDVYGATKEKMAKVDTESKKVR